MRDCGRETTRDNCRSDLISATNVNASSTANAKICVDSSMADIKAGLRPVICEHSRRTTEHERRLEVELPIFRGRSFLHQGSYIVKFHARLYLSLSLGRFYRPLSALQHRSTATNCKTPDIHGRRSAETAYELDVYTTNGPMAMNYIEN